MSDLYDVLESDRGIIRGYTEWNIEEDKILDHIDFRTGEIIETREYDSSEFLYSNIFTEKDYKEHKRTSVAPSEFTSKYQLDLYMEGVDKRKLVTYNAVKDRYGDDCYQHDIEKRNKRELNKPMTKVLKKLVDNLVYRNIIIDTKEGLADKIGVDKSNLMKTLKTAKWLIRVETEEDGMKKGHIKVFIHPDFAFKHYSPKHSNLNINTARQNALIEWCKPSFDDVSKHIDWLITPINERSNCVLKAA